MKKRITFLFLSLVMMLFNASAQYTTDGLYTIQCVGTTKYMSINPATGQPYSCQQQLQTMQSFTSTRIHRTIPCSLLFLLLTIVYFQGAQVREFGLKTQKPTGIIPQVELW